MKSKLIDIAEIILGHTFRSSLKEDSRANTFILQAKNVGETGQIMGDLARVYLEKNRSQAWIKQDDVVLVNRGLFRSAVFCQRDKNILASSSVYLLRCDFSRLLPCYLAIFLNSSKGRGLLSRCMSGGTIKSLSKKELSNLPITLPSLRKQQKIIAVDKTNRALQNAYQRQKDLQEQISKTLISKLIKG